MLIVIKMCPWTLKRYSVSSRVSMMRVFSIYPHFQSSCWGNSTGFFSTPMCKKSYQPGNSRAVSFNNRQPLIYLSCSRSSDWSLCVMLVNDCTLPNFYRRIAKELPGQLGLEMGRSFWVSVGKPTAAAVITAGLKLWWIWCIHDAFWHKTRQLRKISTTSPSTYPVPLNFHFFKPCIFTISIDGFFLIKPVLPVWD